MNARHGQRLKLLTNAIFSGLTAASSLILLLLFLFAARRLGVEALGAIALGMAVGNAITFMLDLGVNSTAIRRIAADRAQAGVTAGHLLTWRLMVSLGCVALFVPGAWLLIDEQVERDAVIIFGIAGVLRSMNFTSRALLQATDRFSSESLLVFIDAVALLLLGYLVLDGGGGPVALAWTFVLVRGAIALFYFFMSSRVIPGLRWKLNWLGMWSLQREGFPLGLATGLSALFWQVDILLLSALATAHATGLYSAAFRIIEGLKVGPDSLGAAFYPRLSYVQQHEPARFDDLFTRGCKYVLIAGVGIGIVLALMAPNIIDSLYGDEYRDAATVLIQLAIIPPLLFLGSFVFVGLRALGRLTPIMLAVASGLLLKLCIGALLISKMNILGAVIAAWGGTCLMAAVALFAMARARASALGVFRALGPIVAATLVSFGIGVLLHRWSPLLTLAGVALAFPAALFLFGAFDRHELNLLHGIWSPRTER